MKKKQNKFKTTSAKKYYDKSKMAYIFPFKCLDDTPDGSNLGRMEWCIEPVRASKKHKEGWYPIEKLYIWARQTRDKQYLNKVFEIPCGAEYIFTSPNENSFFSGVWMAGYCPEHKNMVLISYPNKDEYNTLVIRNWTSIGVDVRFAKDGEYL